MSDESSTPKTLWEADATHPDTSEKIRQALREVTDPELGLSIIELGLVRQLSIEDGRALLKMILTTPFCPYGPAILENARAKTEEVSGLETRIELGMEMWSPSLMEDSAMKEWGLF